MKQNYSFQTIRLALTAEALAWLARTTVNDRKEVISHFTILNDFLRAMRTDAGADGTFRRPIEISAGMAQYAEIELGQRHGFGRTRMRNIISKMEELGLLEVDKSTIGSVAALTAVTGWQVGGDERTRNPYYTAD